MIPTRPKGDSEPIEAHVRRLIKHIDSIESVILRIALLVFLIAALAQAFTLNVRSINLPQGFDGSEFRLLIALTLTGIGGIAVLTLTILIFVYFLRGQTKQLKGLEVRVVSAFMKALDETPLESHTMDKKYREQLNPQ